MHNLQIHSTRTTLKHQRSLQPYFKSRKGINQMNLHCIITNKICHQFFSHNLLNARKQKKLLPTSYLQGQSAVFTRLPTSQHHLENKVTSSRELCSTRDFLQMHLQEPDYFWFTSNGFLKRPISLKYWLLHPFSTR